MTNSSQASHTESEAPDETQSKTPTKKSRTSRSSSERSQSAPPRRPKRLRPVEALRMAREQLGDLTGKPVDAVTTFAATDDGWCLEVEVLELTRVPDTMSLLASYEVTLDQEGILTGYQRLRRYERGRSDDRS
ncbi:gas vesicle protein [Streptomyces sp. SID14478]|nr:gas vesicle protein [Streptomyces sp. SID14478]NEB80660.1 gas vesicle protein [Streptomyces sp. SID14478]